MPSGSHTKQRRQYPERPGGSQNGDGEAGNWGDEFGNATRGATGDFGLRSEAPKYQHLYPKRPGGAQKRDGMAPPGWGDEYGNPDRGALGDFGTTGWDDPNIGMDDGAGDWGDEHGNPDRGATGWGPDNNYGMGDFGGTGWDDPNIGMGDFGLSGWGDDCGMGDFGGTGWDDKNLGMGDKFDDYRSKETQQERAKKRHIMGVEVSKRK